MNLRSPSAILTVIILTLPSIAAEGGHEEETRPATATEWLFAQEFHRWILSSTSASMTVLPPRLAELARELIEDVSPGEGAVCVVGTMLDVSLNVSSPGAITGAITKGWSSIPVILQETQGADYMRFSSLRVEMADRCSSGTDPGDEPRMGLRVRTGANGIAVEPVEGPEDGWSRWAKGDSDG